MVNISHIKDGIIYHNMSYCQDVDLNYNKPCLLSSLNGHNHIIVTRIHIISKLSRHRVKRPNLSLPRTHNSTTLASSNPLVFSNVGPLYPKTYPL